MPTKLGMSFRNGKSVIVANEVPDLDEAKRLWREGKSAQYILEQHKKKSSTKSRKTG